MRNSRGRFGFPCFIAVATLLATGASLFADALHYQFNGNKTPIYQVSIVAELPKSSYTLSGQLYYNIASVDRDSGQIRLNFATAFRNASLPADQGAPAADAGHAEYFGPPSPNSTDIVVDSQGTLVSIDQSADTQLGFLLGPQWHLLFPALPATDQLNWTTDRDLVIYETKGAQRQDNGPFGFAPRPFWHQQAPPPNRVDRQSHETVKYSIAATDGNLVTITVNTDTATAERVDDAPVIHQTGIGQFVFDKQAGMVTSLSMKYENDWSIHNVSVKVPVQVEVRLLTGQELARIQSARQANIDQAANAQRLDQIEHADDCGSIPDGSSKTPMIGGQGGGPYIICRAGKKTVIGYKIIETTWAGRPGLHIVHPLYEKPTIPEGADVHIELGKPGYVVGGLMLRGSDSTGADGLRVIFMRMTDKGLDASDTYMTRWYGLASGESVYQLAGKGQRVIGQFGRQGLNTDAIGLVVDGIDTSASADASPADPGSVDSSGDSSPVNPSQAAAPENPDVNEIPADSRRTTMIGDQGGGPFIKCLPSKRTLLGFRFRTGNWAGRDCVSGIEPMWDRPSDADANNTNVVVARPGYVVGGMIVNGDDHGAYGMRVIFVAVAGDHLDPTNRYLSPWYGDANGSSYTQLAGKGQRVIGIFGRQGMNVDAIGLVLDGAAR